MPPKRLFLLLLLLASCNRAPRTIEPHVMAPPHPKEVRREKRILVDIPKDFSITPFAPLSPEEAASDWGKEYRIALGFADDFDLYRAITGFKRALYLLPAEERQRRLEIEYAVALSYYLGKKYVESVHAVEGTELVTVDQNFPAFSDLLLLLYDSYTQLGREKKAEHIFSLIEQNTPDNARKLSLLNFVQNGELACLCDMAHQCPDYSYFDGVVGSYERQAKSIGKAETLNALLPGAGYWYVGLKQTAVTAFLVNALFIAAGAHFISNGNVAAGAITLSLESGWYLGGIYGAGLAAKRYNEHLYDIYGSRIAEREHLFPVMMLKYTF